MHFISVSYTHLDVYKRQEVLRGVLSSSASGNQSEGAIPWGQISLVMLTFRLFLSLIHIYIWYMEHWTILLDIYIIYKTVANVIVGEKNAY